MPPGAFACPSMLPMNGTGWPGLPSCQRMISINVKPNAKNNSDVIPYWMPIIL